MGRFFSLFLVLFVAMAGAANAAQCTLDPRVIVATSPYFATQMAVKQFNTSSVTLQSNDDGRFIVNFSMDTPPASTGLSVSQFLAEIRKETAPYLASHKAKGQWAELATFPYDPVSWRTVEETTVADVGPAFQGRMYIRLNSDCLLTANFLAPSSANLLSKWHAFNAAITDLRTSAAQYVTAGDWADEDTTPTGVKAIIGGFALPVVLSLIAYYLLNHLSRLDAPNALTRVVLICAAAVSLGGFGLQYSAYQEEFHLLRYTDNALLLGFCGILSLAAITLAQRATLLSLLTSCIGGLTLVSLSYFDWTPDPIINSLVGGSLVIMGGLGFLSWSMTSPVAVLIGRD